MDINAPHSIVADPLVNRVDLLLSGDDAIVIGLPCRGKPENPRCTGLPPSPCRGAMQRGAMQEPPRG